MPLTLNREARQKLFDEDVAWLLSQPRTLERDHIEQVLRWAMETAGTAGTSLPKVAYQLRQEWRRQMSVGAAQSFLREGFDELGRLARLNHELAKKIGCLYPDEYGQSCCEPPCIVCQALSQEEVPREAGV